MLEEQIILTVILGDVQSVSVDVYRSKTRRICAQSQKFPFPDGEDLSYQFIVGIESRHIVISI